MCSLIIIITHTERQRRHIKQKDQGVDSDRFPEDGQNFPEIFMEFLFIEKSILKIRNLAICKYLFLIKVLYRLPISIAFYDH